MTNILDYISWRGDLSFDADPFNAVDNLILARLVYIDFDDLAPEGERLTPVGQRYMTSETKLKPGVLLNDGTKPLLEAAMTSKRFGDLTLKAYKSKIDIETQIQFTAMVFEIDEETAYIAYRGTDDTLVGWKEDFNMTFMDEVPAQAEAIVYLDEIMATYDYKNLYIGGHSKGGNLAVYGAVHLDDVLKPRLVAVYNNDGPGFKNKMMSRPAYKIIADKIVTLIPKSSVVGLLLEHEEAYQIVESNQVGVLQHDCLSWAVQGKDFVYLPALSRDALMFDTSSRRTLDRMSPEQRAAFTNVLFDLLALDDSKTLTDLMNAGIRGFFKRSKSYRDLDEETRKMISETLNIFFDESYKSFLEVTELDQVGERWKAWREETRKELATFIKGL